MGPFKCPECGVWWAGVEHRCALVFGLPPVGTTPDPGHVTPDGYWVTRPYVGPMDGFQTTSAPWCGICAGQIWHIPGAGPCPATYSAAES